MIGGKSQEGAYKLDCRYNKDDLISRIVRISKYKWRIRIYRRDALDFMKEIERLSIKPFVCIDPPYFHKGSTLYTNFYNPEDHEILARAILELKCPWVVTYDNAKEIRQLYRNQRQYNFDINYSVQAKRLGTELLIPSEGLRLPVSVREKQVHRPQYPVSGISADMLQLAL